MPPPSSIGTIQTARIPIPKAVTDKISNLEANLLTTQQNLTVVTGVAKKLTKQYDLLVVEFQERSQLLEEIKQSNQDLQKEMEILHERSENNETTFNKLIDFLVGLDLADIAKQFSRTASTGSKKTRTERDNALNVRVYPS